MGSPKHKGKGVRGPRPSASVNIRYSDGTIQRVKRTFALHEVAEGKAEYVDRTAYRQAHAKR